MKHEEEDAAVAAAYKIVADKAEHLARTGGFAISAIANWEDHRQDAALAIARKKGEPEGYLTVTGLRALRYSHAAALRERYVQQQHPQSDANRIDDYDAQDDEDREDAPEEPARPGGWARWRRARMTLEMAAPALSWKSIRTLSAILAADMDFDAAAKRLGVSRATAYRLFRNAVKEFRRRCPFR